MSASESIKRGLQEARAFLKGQGSDAKVHEIASPGRTATSNFGQDLVQSLNEAVDHAKGQGADPARHNLTD